MSSTAASSLLDQLARFAASVTGTSAAVIDVPGRRSDPTPVRAVFGLTRDQAEVVARFDATLRPSALRPGPGLTVLPDLPQDARFTPGEWDSSLPPPRFLAHRTLLSPGGERVGFLCVLDQDARPGLTDAQATALSHVADLVIADRKREQRHLHLMHVANRTLRIDRMLRIVAEAACCATALTGIVEDLCRFHDAALGRIWQLTVSDGSIHEISHYNQDKDSYYTLSASEPADALSFIAADTIRSNKPHAIIYSKLEKPERIPLLSNAVASGLAGQVNVPIWLQHQRFGVSLAFATERPDFNEVVADVASLANTIRPALFRKVTEDRTRFVAHHDSLTQLSNRLMFHERLNAAFSAARGGEGLALLYLDLDGFKLVNDICGHEVGDKLLVAVAQRLRHNVREGDTVARIGGDEFAIIQVLNGQPLAATILAERLLDTIRQPFNLDGQQSVIGVSIGIAIYPADGETPDLLLRNADTALYRAKEAGRNTYRLFNPSMNTSQQERLLVEQELAGAIEGQQFTLAYQPICDSVSLDVLGFEALLRWRHPARGLIQPDQFIPLAESSGLIVPLGRWALEAACAEVALWGPSVTVSVNLSPLQFRQPELPQQVAEILQRTGLPAGRLDLEVTEGVLLDESGVVLHSMKALKEQGVRITLDDFGTAYASLSYLRRFPFDRIKIDQSFIRGMCGDDGTLAIVQAIILLGKRLDLAVVAEGVETERELETLRRLDCSLVQGYLVGRPMAGEQALAMLAQPVPLGARRQPVLSCLPRLQGPRSAHVVSTPARSSHL